MDILYLAAAFLAGWWICKILTLRKILNDPDEFLILIKRYKELQKEVEDKSTDDPSQVRVEKHGNQIYIYVKDTDEFLAQGSSLEEALDRISKRYPDRVFKGIIPKEDVDKFGLSKQN